MWKTLISKPSKLIPTEKKETFSKVLKDVRAILDDDETIKKILDEYPNRRNENREEYVKNREKRIKKVLNLAGLKSFINDLNIELLDFLLD